nr:P6 [Southern rice black-streaked dwarf virus]
MSTNLTNIAMLKKRLQRRVTANTSVNNEVVNTPSQPLEPVANASSSSESSVITKRYARPSNKISSSSTVAENSDDTKLLHNLISAAPNASVLMKPNTDVLNLSKTQTILPSLVVNATCQLKLKDLNDWKGFVLCHPNSPQSSVSSTLYTGNKLFVVFQKKNVQNDDSEFKMMMKDKAFTFLDSNVFKPKSKEFMTSLYNASSNVIITDSELEFDDLSNLKICFSPSDIPSLTSLHKRMIKFSFWPSNILIPHLTEIVNHFETLKLAHFEDIELDSSNAESSLFIVSNNKFSEQSENVLQFIDAQPNSQLLINKINDMNERFGSLANGTHFMIGTVPSKSELDDDKKKNLFGSNHVILMVNPVNILFDTTQLYFLLFSYLNKFVMQASIVQVFTTDLVNHGDMFSVAFNVIKCFYDSISCTLINHVIEDEVDVQKRVLMTVDDLSDDIKEFIPPNATSTEDSETDNKRVENEIKALIKFDSQKQQTSTSKTLEVQEQQRSWADVVERTECDVEKTSSIALNDAIKNMTYEDFVTNAKLIEFARRYSDETGEAHKLTVELARLTEENGQLVNAIKHNEACIIQNNEEILNLREQSDRLTISLKQLDDAYSELVKEKDEVKTERDAFEAKLQEANKVIVEKTTRLNEAIDELEKAEDRNSSVVEEEPDNTEHRNDGFSLFGECLDKVRLLKNKYPHLYSGVDANFGDLTSLLRMLLIKIDSITSLCDANVTVSENQWSAYGLCSLTSSTHDNATTEMLSVNQVGLMNFQVANFTNIVYDVFFYNMFIKFLWQLSSE